MSDEWLTLREAHTRVCRAHGGSEYNSRPMMIIDLAAAGELATRAEKVILGGKVMTESERVLQEAWEMVRRDRGVVQPMQNSLSCQIGTGLRSSPKELRAYGLLISRTDLEAAVPQAEESRPPSRTPVGGATKISEWHEFYLALIKSIYDGTAEQQPSQAALRRKILDEIDNRLSEESAKTVIRSVWHQVLGK